MPGPLPKDPEDRVRRNKTGEDGIPYETYELEGEVKPPSLDLPFATKEVQELWEALKKSVNREFYEPTDWIYAKMTLRMWDSVLTKNEVPGAMLLSALDGMLSKMLVTEADRRRLKIDAKRTKPEKKPQNKASDRYRQLFEDHKHLRAVQ
jgi:hypothetical protein